MGWFIHFGLPCIWSTKNRQQIQTEQFAENLWTTWSPPSYIWLTSK